MQKLLLVMGQASPTLPVGIVVSGVDSEVAMCCRVDCADVELVEADDSLKLEKQVLDLLCLCWVGRKVFAGNLRDELCG